MLGKKQLVKILTENNKSLLFLEQINKSKARTYSKKEARKLLELAEINLNNYEFLKQKKITGRPKIYTFEENRQRNRDRLNKTNLLKRQNKNKNKSDNAPSF